MMRPREHYVQQLAAIYTELRALGQMVVNAITEAIEALARQDGTAAGLVLANDRRIDEAQYALEEHTLGVMATQQPTAGDLRRVIAAIEIASELERVGDYAKGIAKITIRMAPPLVMSPVDIAQMAQQAIAMLGMAIDAFVREDVEAARRLAEADDHVDALGKRIQAELVDLMQHDPKTVAQAADLLFVAHNLERIADRATNIAERVIFMVSGEIVALNP